MPCQVVGSRKCRCGEHKTDTMMDCVSDHSLIRKLFSDHSWYTFSYVQAAVFKNETAEALKARLIENQIEIGSELGRFPKVGAANGKTITTLLTNHIVRADAAVNAAIKGDKKLLKQASEILFAQGDEMSEAFAKVLELDIAEMKKQFRAHNQHVLNITTLLLQHKNFIQELDAYTNHMLFVADIIFSAVEIKE